MILTVEEFGSDEGRGKCDTRKALDLSMRGRFVLHHAFLGVLFPVRHPDILDLHGVIEKPAAFTLLRVEPVDGPAFVGEHLL